MLLEPYRVLDLTRQRGMLCGQIFADLGADVIQVEPPGGANGRHRGPFAGDVRDPERSLSWWAYARGKRSVELDPSAAEDAAMLQSLVASADILIESEPVGTLAPLGLDYAAAAALNPLLIYVSITGFGIDGPKAHWYATDLVVAASGGPMAITGDKDRAPVRVSVPQAFEHAAAEAAAGALVALHARTASGRGQHVWVSAQQAITIATQGNSLAHEVNEETAQRMAGGVVANGVDIRLTFPASDGYVSITFIFGATVGPATRRLMEYVCEEGFCDAATRDKDWVEYGLLLADGREPIEEFERVKQCVAACTASKSKAELLDAAITRRLLLAPMSDVADVVNSPQFAAREYFRHPDGDGEAAGPAYPGAFARFSQTPLATGRRPPQIGEHTDELRRELSDISRDAPPVAEANADDRAAASNGPLHGVKILDFMWALAGPGATRFLADFGATVVRIESTSKLDVCRTIRPFIDGNQDPEWSAVFHSTNAGKKMLTVDLTNPDAKELIYDLVRWADVVTESFTPRAMKALGFDYATLRTINPDIVMLSTCLMGQTGPLASFAGYGNLAAAIAGFYELTGWPDREPAGPFGAYTDYIAPRYNAIAVLAALDHRRRTGVGQHIDLAQAEASLHFLSPAVLEYTVNGRVWGRLGNADPDFAPHGVYRCAGDDRWIAIACETDDQWHRLARLVGLDPEHRDYATSDERVRHAHAIDEAIARYTAERANGDLETQLQSAGVPAARIQNAPELSADAQLTHLRHFRPIEHPEAQRSVVEAPRVHLSATPGRVNADVAPMFAQHMQEVLNDLLGYDDERFGELLVQGVLQ